HQLDKNFGMGRIWRLVHDDFKPGPQPRMNDETPAQLVAHLEHPNGWWRDTAQKLLTLRGDKSVVPALQKMARTSPNPLARLHALWTLEGLEAIDASLVREAMKDSHPQIRAGAIRISETLYKSGDKSVAGDIRAMASDKEPNVVIQSMLTANLLKWPDAKPFIEATIASSSSAGVKEIGTQLIAPPRQEGPVVQLTAAERKLLDRGKAIYQELCFACHGPDGRGMKVDGAPAGTTLAPPLGGSKTALGHRDGMINVVLHGLTGPVAGKKYDALMVPMESNDDEWIASVVSFIRNSFGNRASFVTPADVARVRAANKGRTEPWTLEELSAVLPQPLKNQKQWKLTASHRKEAVAAAVDGNLSSRYDTGASQTPGMWFQVELPQEATIAGLQLDSTPSPRDYPRGYKVELSMDGQNWGQPVASGKGNAPVTEITFSPAKVKFVRITQTGAVDGLFWSIHEMEIYQPSVPVTATKTAKKPAASYE
ncbi:MAG: discoidin domain-containing protein, partial [Opitutaceae bacterium]|nr:discoidin domain-containing protein [Verrucomicrobiales bacterium]